MLNITENWEITEFNYSGIFPITEIIGTINKIQLRSPNWVIFLMLLSCLVVSLWLKVYMRVGYHIKWLGWRAGGNGYLASQLRSPEPIPSCRLHPLGGSGFSNGSCHHVEDLKCVPGLITSICKINQQMEVLSLPFKINKQEKKKDTS